MSDLTENSDISLWEKCKAFIVKYKELILFLLVGGVNTAFGYGVYALFLFIGFAYPTASLISVILGPVFNYFTYGGIVFRKKPTLRTTVKFALTYVFLYLWNLLWLFLLQKIGFNAYTAGMVTAVLVPVTSFLINKFFVFR